MAVATYEIFFRGLPDDSSKEVSDFADRLKQVSNTLLADCVESIKGPFFHPNGKPWSMAISFHDSVSCTQRTLHVLGTEIKRIREDMKKPPGFISRITVR